MALNKLYDVYGIDTSFFYTDEEAQAEKKLMRAKYLKSKLKAQYKSKKRKTMPMQRYKFLNAYIREHKKSFQKMLLDFKGKRVLREDMLTEKRIVSIFDSALTRAFEMDTEIVNTDLFIVQVYFFEVAHNIITDGFTYNGSEYVYFSSSAGQIRTKKIVCVRKDKLDQCWNTLTAGLTVDRINQLGGMNVNKYLAYLALCNSATDVWKGFDIDRTIVVNDMETAVSGLMDYIDDKTYEIERVTKEVLINHMDGCGMMLPSVSKRNFMVRLPFFKGLLGVFDFKSFIIENNASPVVQDIYGKEWNILEDDIQVIFTKSQFKTWKYFSDWDSYKTAFKKYGCTANKCNEEEQYIPYAKINYQMLQTLTDLTEDELKEISAETNEILRDLSKDRETALRVFGATKYNYNKSFYQLSLMFYPELLNDGYAKSTLNEIKRSIIKDAYAGKLFIKGKYTFILPDLYAFCEYLFLGESKPKGLLADGEVSCRLFKKSDKLDCLRSPHLYKEHAVRNNVIDPEKKKWFVTDALYTSCHDLISRILMFDVDGDKALVVSDETVIAAAERNMADAVPLFYNMYKAGSKEINRENLYQGLMLAFTGGNIGPYSNNISKIWNCDSVTGEHINVVKWLTFENNSVIDYAKTLYKPTRPENVNAIIRKYTGNKLPNFFIYAKDKRPEQVQKINNSPVNRLQNIIPKYRTEFKSGEYGTFDYKVLMNNPNITVDENVINKFISLTRCLKFRVSDSGGNEHYLLRNIRAEMSGLGYSESDIVDMLTVWLYEKNSKRKAIYWALYGEIIYGNIQSNLASNFSWCKGCGKRFYKKSGNQLYCPACQKKRARKNKTKVIKCKSCGKNVRVSIHSRVQRCEECAKEERRRIKRENIQKARNKKQERGTSSQ